MHAAYALYPRTIVRQRAGLGGHSGQVGSRDSLEMFLLQC